MTNSWQALVGVGWQWLVLVLVGNGWQWMPTTVGISQVTFRSIYSPIVLRRKWRLFLPKKGTTSHLVAKTKLITTSITERNIRPLQALFTSDLDCSCRHIGTPVTPLGSNSTNSIGQQTHIDEHHGYRRHRTFLDRNSSSSTRQVPRPTRLPLARQLDLLRGPILHFDGHAGAQARPLC